MQAFSTAIPRLTAPASRHCFGARRWAAVLLRNFSSEPPTPSKEDTNSPSSQPQPQPQAGQPTISNSRWSFLPATSLASDPLQRDEYGQSHWSVLPIWKMRSAATSRLWLSRVLGKKENNMAKKQPSKKRNILMKRMKDSYVELFLNFKSDPVIREEYINFYGGVRISKVLEDLDALAGSISYMHADDKDADSVPLTIVTASVDRMDLLAPLSIEQDYKLSGYVTWVGTSSMEVSLFMQPVQFEGEVKVASGVLEHSHPYQPAKIDNPILVAKFTMVARDPLTNKAAPINQLNLETDEERRIFQLGAQHKLQKKLGAELSLQKLPPSAEEMREIHALWVDYSKYRDDNTSLPPNTVWMSSTKLSSVTLCHPQDRNIHGFVFGGYLMRLAYELAYANANAFCHSRPHFTALDDIVFRKPVSIGSQLRLDSTVVYSDHKNTDKPTFQVQVTADVVDPVTYNRETTNVFQFTFHTDDANSVPRVLPRSYDESMKYIEGKRRKMTAVQKQGWTTGLFSR